MATFCTSSIFFLLFFANNFLSSYLILALPSPFPQHRFPSSMISSPKTSLLQSNLSTSPYRTHFFTQTLDHFSFTPSSFQTFQQRYLLNTQHWGGSQHRAPIFVYCGNEGDITWFAQNTGFLWEIAPQFRAMIVFIEHRYYGESIPNLALKNQTAETLGYLTSEQALADYAIVIEDLKTNYSAEESPVVAFGGSYGGSKQRPAPLDLIFSMNKGFVGWFMPTILRQLWH